MKYLEYKFDNYNILVRNIEEAQRIVNEKFEKEEEFFTDPADPRLLTLPTINTDAYIQKVGVDQNNQIAVPDNIHFAGWYINSVKPGEKGLSIIDGHVDGLFNPGVFRNLKELKQEDIFTIEYGNGSIYTFKVVDKKEISTEDAAKVLFSKNPGIVSQLNLITCVGVFDPSVQSYDKRLIVIAEKI
ncbi:sortase A [Patescibacteria group bacterium]|nr:sortase A [Patescibacteria group bacterium]